MNIISSTWFYYVVACAWTDKQQKTLGNNKNRGYEQHSHTKTIVLNRTGIPEARWYYIRNPCLKPTGFVKSCPKATWKGWLTISDEATAAGTAWRQIRSCARDPLDMKRTYCEYSDYRFIITIFTINRTLLICIKYKTQNVFGKKLIATNVIRHKLSTINWIVWI